MLGVVIHRSGQGTSIPNELSNEAIDIYDNAMLIIALKTLIDMLPNATKTEEWKALKKTWKQTADVIYGTTENRNLFHISTPIDLHYLQDSMKIQSIIMAGQPLPLKQIC